MLKAVNSPFYGLSNKITSVHQAMVFLGLNAVKNLALSFSLLSGFAPKRKGAFDYVQFSKDALVGAVAARTLTETVNRRQGENAFFLGLLQDIGMLILAEAMPEEYAKSWAKPPAAPAPCTRSKARLLGMNHMEVGEFVTESWGLPASFSVPIGYHHSPERIVPPHRRYRTDDPYAPPFVSLRGIVQTARSQRPTSQRSRGSLRPTGSGPPSTHPMSLRG